jgi:hypothetical protein
MDSMKNIELGSEGLKRLATMYLDAIANTQEPPDPRVVKKAITAADTAKANLAWQKTKDEVDKELLSILSRFEPAARKGRALQKQA